MIRKEKEKAFLTIEQLAEMAGISSNFLACIVTQKRKPSIATIVKIAKVLNVSASSFLEDFDCKKNTDIDMQKQILSVLKSVKPLYRKILLSTIKNLAKDLTKKK